MNTWISYSVQTPVDGIANSVIAKSEGNDCSVRAMAVACNTTYDSAHSWVAKNWNRLPKKGIKLSCLFDYAHTHIAGGFKFNFIDTSKDNVIAKSTTDPVRTASKIIARKSRREFITISEFIKRYPRGRYLVIVSGHALAVVDGVMYDHPCFAKSFLRRVTTAFKVEKD